MDTSKTFLIGLLGEGISASRSPDIHQSEARALGLVLVYRMVDFQRLRMSAAHLSGILTAAEDFGFNGLNITHPFKQLIIPLLSELSREATIIGSVNTVLLREGSRVGHNTDWLGFFESFRTGLPGVSVQKVVQFGAGGGGAAVAYALMQLGTRELFIVDTNRRRAEDLVLRMQANFPGRVITSEVDAAAIVPFCNGVVQTTPVGMDSYPGIPFDAGLLKPHHWLAEVIYFPAETELLKFARSIGCKTISGGGMVVLQAAKAFELFTGITPDVNRMLKRFWERTE